MMLITTVFVCLFALLVWGIALSNVLLTYPAVTSGTGGLTSLASSSTFLAGYEWFYIDNSSAKSPDYRVQGKITVGTTPTANTNIIIYVFAVNDGSTYPDVMDGTPSAETVTNVGVGQGFLKRAATINVPATTSNVGYEYEFCLTDIFGKSIPTKTGVFVAHNTVAALNGTAGNHTYMYAPINPTVG